MQRAIAAMILCVPMILAAKDTDWVDPELGDTLHYAQRVRATISAYSVVSLIGPIDTPLPIEIGNFLLDHPDMTAYIVNRHRLAPYQITMKGPREAWANDGEGTQGLITLTQRETQSRVYYGNGFHESSILPRVHAESVILLSMSPKDVDGCARIESSFKVYVRLKSAVLGWTVKALRPLVSNVVGRIFTKAFMVADRVGRLFAADPAAIAEEMRSYSGLTDQDRRLLDKLLADYRQEHAKCR